MGSGQGWGQGGCERRIKVMMKMKKKSRRGVRSGEGMVRVMINKELKLL